MFDKKPPTDDAIKALLELIDLRVLRGTHWERYKGLDNSKYNDAECARLAAIVLKR